MRQVTIPSDLRSDRYAGISDDWTVFLANLHALEDRGWTFREIHDALGDAVYEVGADIDAALFSLLQQPSPAEREEAEERRREYALDRN